VTSNEVGWHDLNGIVCVVQGTSEVMNFDWGMLMFVEASFSFPIIFIDRVRGGHVVLHDEPIFFQYLIIDKS